MALLSRFSTPGRSRPLTDSTSPAVSLSVVNSELESEAFHTVFTVRTPATLAGSSAPDRGPARRSAGLSGQVADRPPAGIRACAHRRARPSGHDVLHLPRDSGIVAVGDQVKRRNSPGRLVRHEQA